MPEYISREEAIKELREVYENEYPTASGNFDEYASHDVPNVLRNIPAADVQPVKCGRWLSHHAIWIDQPKIEGWFVQAKCSECEKWAHAMNPYTKSVDYECCPHCGARMDLKDGDTE